MNVFIAILIFLLLFIIGIAAWLLSAPFTISLDSTQSKYQLKWNSIGKADFNFNEDRIEVNLQVFFIKKKLVNNWQTFVSKKSKRKEKRKVKIKNSVMKIKKILQSFELKKLWINVDTDNFYNNAFLYPIFFFTQRSNCQFNVNFQGEQEFILILKNRPGKILLAYLLNK